MREARQKILNMGGYQWLDGGGIKDFPDGGGTGLHGGDKGLMGGSPPIPPTFGNPVTPDSHGVFKIRK